MAPREFGAKVLGQTPATDPESLIGRLMEVGVPDITGDGAKYYMKILVRIMKVEGKTCLTSFGGLECTRDHLLRMIRKRNQKVETVVDVTTKDGWILRIKPWTILNGKPVANIETKMRHLTASFFNDFAGKSDMGEFVRKVLTTEMQMMLKKTGSKVYPVRFSEIARIKVLKSPEFHAARPEKAEEEAVAEEKPAEKEAAPNKERKKAVRKQKVEKAETKENKKKQEAE